MADAAGSIWKLIAGTAELRRYGLKLRRYAHFFLSGSWRREYERFPEIRIVTAHRPRVRRMLGGSGGGGAELWPGRARRAAGRARGGGDVGTGVPCRSERFRMDSQLCWRSARVTATGQRCRRRAGGEQVLRALSGIRWTLDHPAAVLPVPCEQARCVTWQITALCSDDLGRLDFRRAAARTAELAQQVLVTPTEVA